MIDPFSQMKRECCQLYYAPINVKPQGGGGGGGGATHEKLTERAFPGVGILTFKRCPRVGNLTWPPCWKTERNWK